MSRAESGVDLSTCVSRTSLPVTTESRLSFRADAASFVEGGQFSFAYLGAFI
jgi:hypothetical protein